MKMKKMMRSTSLAMLAVRTIPFLSRLDID
jgi:hypothetical protein